ncbi:MAG: hypothetical protein EXX96DRAFT_578193, partial [Benjaminiella poitrasii]
MLVLLDSWKRACSFGLMDVSKYLRKGADVTLSFFSLHSKVSFLYRKWYRKWTFYVHFLYSDKWNFSVHTEKIHRKCPFDVQKIYIKCTFSVQKTKVMMHFDSLIFDMITIYYWIISFITHEPCLHIIGLVDVFYSFIFIRIGHFFRYYTLYRLFYWPLKNSFVYKKMWLLFIFIYSY